jgi:uncharacterized RDD family membrane protein YckC
MATLLLSRPWPLANRESLEGRWSWRLAPGKTVGNWLTRTVVVAESGEPAKWWQLLFRSAYRFVPFAGFSFLPKSRPGWHDRWSKTRVVMDRRS